MAQLTVAGLMNYVKDFIPGKTQAKTVRAANLVLQRIYRKIGQTERLTFTTKAPVSTGTVSATANNTAVTFSGNVLSASDPLTYIQIDGDATWYTLTRVTDSTGTLSSAFAGTTGAALGYQIVYPAVTFPTNVMQVLGIWSEGYVPLRFAGTEHIPQLSSLLAPGKPEFFSPYLMDSSATSPDDERLRVLLIAPPDKMYSYTYAYKRRPTLLDATGADTQKLTLPDYFNETILTGTLYFVWDQEDANPRSVKWKTAYEEAWKEAMAEANVSVSTRFDDAYDSNIWDIFETRPVGL